MNKALILLALLGMFVTLQADTSKAQETCWLSGQRVSGKKRICYYNCFGREYEVAIDITQLCPPTISH